MQNQTVWMLNDWRPIVALVLQSLVIMGSPGPSTISVTAVAASYGVRRSIGYTWGLIIGTIVALVLVALGVMVLVTSMAYGARVLSIVSAAYICFLAYKIATSPPLSDLPDQASAPPFLAGLGLAVANPKAYLAIAAVFAAVTIFPANSGLDAGLKTLILSVMIVVIHFGWLLAGAMLSRFLHHPVTSRVMNVSMAVVLVGMTIYALAN